MITQKFQEKMQNINKDAATKTFSTKIQKSGAFTAQNQSVYSFISCQSLFKMTFHSKIETWVLQNIFVYKNFESLFFELNLQNL
jgi:hypothetical protein